jgi:dihydrodipicolinate synthase/N-acetylneuraminate lyase
MTSSNLPTPLRGIIPPLVTPLLDSDQLDSEGLERLVEHLLAGGVHGLFILGTTGEGPSLSNALRRQMIERTVRQVASRVPVFVGITDTSIIESVSLANYSADMGADAVVASAPHYYQIDQSQLYDYIKQLVAMLPLPLVLYNMPSLTKVNFEAETIRRMLSWDRVLGIKDSSGDMEYTAGLLKVIKERPDWTLMTGPEELLADALRAGVLGGVCGGANIFPRLYVDLYEADRRKDFQMVRALHEDIMQISRLLYSIGHHSTSFMKGIKCALSCLGLCHNYLASPLCHFQDAECRVVQQRLQQIAQLESNGIQMVMNRNIKIA